MRCFSRLGIGWYGEWSSIEMAVEADEGATAVVVCSSMSLSINLIVSKVDEVGRCDIDASGVVFLTEMPNSCSTDSRVDGTVAAEAGEDRCLWVEVVFDKGPVDVESVAMLPVIAVSSINVEWDSGADVGNH